MAERADADDRAELALAPHVEEKHRANLARNRDELDAVLAMPVGLQAVAEQALIKQLGGAA